MSRRTKSLFCQGPMRYEGIPDCPEPRLRHSVERFAERLEVQRLFRRALGII